jgi:membrane associated rhomboid family serine protease
MLSTSEIATLAVVIVTVLTSISAFNNPMLLMSYVLDVQSVRRGEHIRLISSGFFHNDWQHLIFNMFSLYVFGVELERIGGTVVFLAIYFGAIVGGSILALFIHRKEEYRAVGASGGVCGVIFATIFFAPGMSIYLFPFPFATPAWLFAILFIGFSAYAGKQRRDNIGHDAHLGGALVGLAIGTTFYPAIIGANPLLYAAVMLGGIAGVIYLSRHQGPKGPGRWV